MHIIKLNVLISFSAEGGGGVPVIFILCKISFKLSIRNYLTKGGNKLICVWRFQPRAICSHCFYPNRTNFSSNNCCKRLTTSWTSALGVGSLELRTVPSLDAYHTKLRGERKYFNQRYFQSDFIIFVWVMITRNAN